MKSTRTQEKQWYPCKHLLIFKTSWRHVLFEDVLKTSSKISWKRLEDVFKKTCKMKNCYAEDFLKASRKTSWRCLQDLLEDEKLLRWRRLEDMPCLKTSLKRVGVKQNVYWGYLCLTNLYFSNLYLAHLKPIKNILIRTQ